MGFFDDDDDFWAGALVTGLVGAGALLVGSLIKDNKKKIAEENRRKGIPCSFSDGISESDFKRILKNAAYCIDRITGFNVEGAVVTVWVRSQSGISEWTFTADFNDYGRLTGNYWLSSENDDSYIPKSFADRVSSEIKSFGSKRINNDSDKSYSPPLVDLQYKHLGKGVVMFRVTHKYNTEYEWQYRKNNSSNWVSIGKTSDNTFTTRTVPTNVGDRYRCRLWIRGKITYVSIDFIVAPDKYNDSYNTNQQKSEQRRYDEESHAKQGVIDFFKGCSTWDQVKDRYKKLMQTYHPDMAAGDEEYTKEINAQYEVLKRKYGQ